MQVVLGLGSNQSWNGISPVAILGRAVKELSAVISGMRYSSIYRTRAMYVENQEDFYNMALTGFVPDTLSAHELLQKIHQIEAALGRDRSKEIRFGPRSCDIDIELFGSQTINTPDLIVPHERLFERAFVLVPMLEIFANSADSIIGDSFLSRARPVAENAADVVMELSAEEFSRFIGVEV